MTAIAHIICPVDLSAFSLRALAYAFAWAQAYDARVRVLHVLAPPTAFGALDGYSTVVPRRPLEEIRAALERFVSEVAIPDVPVDLDILEGEAAEVIRLVADQDSHAVLVMGTRGRSGLTRLVLGSTAESVAHYTTRPLLVVPPHEEGQGRPRATFARMLCAVDFRPSSVAALGTALDLAREMGATLDIVTVLEMPHDEEMRAARHYGAAEYRIQRSQDLLRELHDLVPEEARRQGRVQERVLTGIPATELLRLAREQRSDLIVMGTGEGFHLGSGWLGHTTDRVMRLAAAPILIVPPRPYVAAREAEPLRRDQWTQELDRMTVQHLGEPTTVSILGGMMGAEREAVSLPLVGLTAERHDDRTDIIVLLGKPDGTHLTHFIQNATEIRAGEARTRHPLELLITADDGTTTLVEIGATRA